MSIDFSFLKYLVADDSFRWNDVPVKDYPAAGTQSRGMTKQILFPGSDRLPMEIRYFEAQPGGYSALETHEHVHHVIVLRGSGHMLFGDTIRRVEGYDSIHIPGWTYHQFYAPENSRLGFICIVNIERDRPQRPSADEIARLEKNPEVRPWLRY